MQFFFRLMKLNNAPHVFYLHTHFKIYRNVFFLKKRNRSKLNFISKKFVLLFILREFKEIAKIFLQKMKLFSPLAVLLAMSSLIMIDCDSIKMSNVYIKWTINGNQTDFEVRSSLDKQLSLTNAWLSFGFSSQMVIKINQLFSFCYI